jgi:hypothetical protein
MFVVVNESNRIKYASDPDLASALKRFRKTTVDSEDVGD